MHSIAATRVAAAVAGMAWIGVPLFFLVRGQPIDPTKLLVTRLFMSINAAILGGLIPTFVKPYVSTTNERLIRAAGALALFLLTFFSVPAILSTFDATSWIAVSSGVFGLSSLLLAALSTIAGAYYTYRTINAHKHTEALVRELTIEIKKFDFKNKEKTNELILLLKNIENENLSIVLKIAKQLREEKQQHNNG